LSKYRYKVLFLQLLNKPQYSVLSKTNAFPCKYNLQSLFLHMQKNNLILRTLAGEQTERTPVWLMRQAGRILPEYRAVRNSVSGFKELVETPELAAEVTIQPVDILDVDAAIIFSDILVVPEAMGLTYEMIEKKGPFFPKTIKSLQDIEGINVIQGDELDYVYQAIKLVRAELNDRVPLIGFAGAPWTIYCYMTEGQGSKTFSIARRMLYQQPELARTLLDKITESTIHYLRRQVEAGAQILQIFDSWAGILGPDQYREFSMHYISRICEAITEVPVIVFAKGAYFVRAEMAGLNCAALGMDWNMDISETRQLVGNEKVLQGNMDPCMLYGEKVDIKAGVGNMLRQFGPDKHIANLGHGLYPDTDADKVKYFIEQVKEQSLKK